LLESIVAIGQQGLLAIAEIANDDWLIGAQTQLLSVA
jgi:hypothetical protein